MSPTRMSQMHILQAIVFTVTALAVESVFSHDCSPPSKEASCECTTTSIHCTGSATNVSEFQSALTLANVSLMETVNLKIFDLKFEPDFNFANTSIRNLTLGYNFQDFPSDFFAGSSSLISLDLQNNSIGSINDQLFFTLSNLKELFLDENHLQELTSSTFATLSDLDFLSIANNRLQKINEQVFQNLSNLRTLILSHNNFSSIENLKLSSKSLTKLEIIHCSMEGVLEKDTFSSVPDLEHLDMSHNRLSEIHHESMSALKNLKFLNLCCNNIQKLQERAFSEMRNLTSLDLKENEISVIKISSFNHLHNLKYLDLSGNKLTAILCEYTTDFHSLERINLQNNKIKTFSQGAFFYSPYLQVLDLTGNTLECSCPLTDTALHLIANSTMKREDLESVSCVIPITLASESVINYESSKCAPEEPCKKLVAEEPEDEDYEDDYSEDESTTVSKTSTMTSTVLHTVTSTAVRTTTVQSTEPQTATSTVEHTSPTTNATTIPITTESSSEKSTMSIMNTTSISSTVLHTVTPTAVRTTTVKSTEPQTATTTAERTTTVKSTEPQTATTTAERTTTVKSTEPQTATTTAEHTSPITNASTIPVATESSSERTTMLILNTTSISSTVPPTVPLTTENTNLTTTKETNIVTTSTSSETRSSISDVTKQSTKNDAATSGVSITSDCSSLSLNVHQSSADSEFLVLSNFSNDGSTFCLKWSIVGNLTNVYRCTIKYSFEGGIGSPTKHLACPSVANEIRTWSYDKKIFHFCIKILVYKPTSVKTKFCNSTSDKTATVTATTTPLLLSNVSLSGESLETIGLPETTTFFTKSNTKSDISTPATELSSKHVTEAETSETTAFRIHSTTTPTPESSKTTPTREFSKTTPTTELSKTTSTTEPSKTTPTLESSKTTPKPETIPPHFEITALNVYFNNSNLAFATWAVNMEAPPQLCNMTLKATTQYFDYEEGVFPCRNNSHRLRYVKETDIFKICLSSQHETSGLLTECTLSVSTPLASKSEKDGKDSVSGSMIPLICLLVLLVLIVLFIIFKNLFKKKTETNKYDVRAEEVKYQQRVKVRPQSANEQSMRFSYIARESSDNV